MPKSEVHPTAIVESGARLGEGVRIGPFCVVGKDVALADGVELVSHVAVAGRTSIGARTRIFPFASIGHQPQDLKYKGEPSTLEVGADCLIREGVTLNPGTAGGGAAVIQFSRVGAHSFLGGMSGLENDLIPYGMALGNRAHLSGLNIIGLQRRGFSREDIHTLRRAYRLLFADEGTLLERLDDVEEEFGGHPIVKEIVDFIRAGGKRSLCVPHPDA